MLRRFASLFCTLPPDFTIDISFAYHKAIHPSDNIVIACSVSRHFINSTRYDVHEFYTEQYKLYQQLTSQNKDWVLHLDATKGTDPSVASRCNRRSTKVMRVCRYLSITALLDIAINKTYLIWALSIDFLESFSDFWCRFCLIYNKL